ncbi:MAG: DNA invertase Pin-like site-specific DNA recombinase [Crocinitomix sp.]|jgi:DNA invertase Pin-like site-specific DNA recombinase
MMVTFYKHPFVKCNYFAYIRCMNTYVAYYRVSTKKQGKSGLGLNAQKTMVKNFIGKSVLIGEFTDVESGTRKGNKRAELKNAIQKALSKNAILVIAKLDRLSRNVSFITDLMESGVEFVACDMPEANKFTIHIFAALAEQEADMISQRVKAALAELKKQGKVLGTPENLTSDARNKGVEIRQKNAIEDENNRKAGALIVSLRNGGKSFYRICKELNHLGFKTRRGGQFQQVQVQRLYSRYTNVNI